MTKDERTTRRFCGSSSGASSSETYRPPCSSDDSKAAGYAVRVRDAVEGVLEPALGVGTNHGFRGRICIVLHRTGTAPADQLKITWRPRREHVQPGHFQQLDRHSSSGRAGTVHENTRQRGRRIILVGGFPRVSDI